MATMLFYIVQKNYLNKSHFLEDLLACVISASYTEWR